MNGIKKKTLSVILALMMVFSLTPQMMHGHATDTTNTKTGTSSDAPVGNVTISGSSQTYNAKIGSKFKYFVDDNIKLKTDNNDYDYRVVVNNVATPEGGSYKWDGTKYTEEDNADIIFKIEDAKKEYVVTYQAQYAEKDSDNWKDIENVVWESKVFVNGAIEKDYVTGDEACIENIELEMVQSGTPDFDDNDERGNDSSGSNLIVRSFDTIKYNANFNTAVADDSSIYHHAYLWAQIDLPCSEDDAAVDTSLLSTNTNIHGLKKETVQKDGRTHTIYTFYYEKKTTTENDGHINHALPQIGHVPFMVKVFGAKHGTTIKPTVTMAVAQLDVDENGEPKKDKKGDYIVARDYSDFDGAYDTPKSAQGPDVNVSARPGFNVKIQRLMTGSVSNLYDFSTGNDNALDRGSGEVLGRAMRFGVMVSLMNNDAKKGIKGLELPDGKDITFELDAKSVFGNDEVDPPLVWGTYYYGGKYDSGRGGLDASFSTVTAIPDDKRASGDHVAAPNPAYDVWNGGDWKLERTGKGKIKITISKYAVNPRWFPTGDPNDGKRYMNGGTLKFGVFSARNIDMIVPFGSDIQEREEDQEPKYSNSSEDNLYYPNVFNRTGDINVTITDSSLDVTSISGLNSMDLYPDSSGQVIYNPKQEDEDCLKGQVTLSKGGSSGRNIFFTKANATSTWIDVNESKYARDNGRDTVVPGTKIGIHAEYTFSHRDAYRDSWVYAGQMLLKFDDKHLEPSQNFNSNNYLFAAKPNGKGWTSDKEMKETGDADLIYYSSIEALKADGKKCVGILLENSQTGEPEKKNQEFAINAKNMLVSKDPEQYNTVSMTSMCFKYWRKTAYNKILELNGGTFPTHADKTLDGKTVEDYLAEKYGLSDEEKKAIMPTGDDLKSSGNLGYRKASYDEDGFHEGTGKTKWGDSLYIIPYRMKIRKFVEQKNGPDSTDSVGYSFEGKEHIADFCLRPYFQMPEIVGNDAPDDLPDNKTNVTVTDELPAGLEYIAGSAYIGGTYKTNPEGNGLHGTVEGGEQKEPDVEILSNGKTILTWKLNDVTVGKELPDIHFSVEMDQEITEHTDWLNTGYVKSDENNMGYSTALGNKDTAKIHAAPAGNFIVRKTPDNLFHDKDEELKWTLRWKNTTVKDYKKMVLADVLPYDGDSRGSIISGSYKITGLKYDFSDNIDVSSLRFYYAADKNARKLSALGADIPYEDFEGDSPTVNGIKWTKAEIGADGTIDAVLDREDVTAYVLLGDIPSKGEARAEIKIKPEGNKPGDRFINVISADKMSQSSGIYIVERGLRGNVWQENHDAIDGRRHPDEKRISGVQVILKIKNGDAWEEVGRTLTDARGRYEFKDLPAGIFKVEFVNTGNQSLKGFFATEKNANGVSDHVDSDAKALYGETVFGEISDIVMPEAKDIHASPYFVEYQDLGVYRPDLTVGKTVDAKDAADEEKELEKEFLFKLTVKDALDETYDIIGSDGNTMATVSGSQLKNGYEFKLRHGESATFRNLPAGADYKVEEFDYEGKGYSYVSSLKEGSDELEGTLDKNREVQVVNTYKPETVELKAVKNWDDAAASELPGYARPISVTATLTADGIAKVSRELSEENKWTESFTDLPKYRNDSWPVSFDAEAAKAIEYGIREDKIEDKGYVEINGERRFYIYEDDGNAIRGYFTYSTSIDAETGQLSIKNTFVPAEEEENGTAGFSVKKVDEKGDVIKGKSARFELVRNEDEGGAGGGADSGASDGAGNGDKEMRIVATDKETGIASFTDLPAGTYTLREIEAPTGYIRTDKTYTVSIEDNGRVFAGADVDNNRNIYERLLTVSGDENWDADSQTLTVVNEKIEGNIIFSKTVDNNRAKQGDILTYTITATNESNTTLTNQVVWDLIPEQLTYQSDKNNGVYGVENGRERIEWTIDEIRPGESKRFILITKVKECYNGEKIKNVAFYREDTDHTEEVPILEDKATTKTDKRLRPLSARPKEVSKSSKKGSSENGSQEIRKSGMKSNTKTGDDAPIGLMIAAFMASAAVIILTGRRTRKRS